MIEVRPENSALIAHEIGLDTIFKSEMNRDFFCNLAQSENAQIYFVSYKYKGSVGVIISQNMVLTIMKLPCIVNLVENHM